MNKSILTGLGFNPKETQVYQFLLKSGQASIRQVAAGTDINRGTVYEALKKLSARGLVSRSRHRNQEHFQVQDPKMLEVLVAEETRRAEELKNQLDQQLPEMLAMYAADANRPTAKIYEGNSGIRFVMEDLLAAMGKMKERERLYRVYSAANIRNHLYAHFKTFNAERVKLGIRVKAIALGEGGELYGLDERRWLTTNQGAPAYIIIYGYKLAVISLSGAGLPIAVLLEDRGVAETQKLIFDALWGKLEK